MIGTAAVGIGAMAVDQQLAQAGDMNAMMRQGQRVMAIANAVRHPVNTVIDAHTQAAENILAAEHSGHWFRASIQAGEIGSADAAAVVGGIEGGVALTRFTASAGQRLGLWGVSAASEAVVAEASTAEELLYFKGQQYEVLSEQSILGRTRSAHRASANRALLQQLESDPEFAQAVNQQFGGVDVAEFMRSGRGQLRNPPGTQWHHPFDNPNAMRLLRRQVHRQPTLQDLLHPEGSGGFANFFGQ